MAELCKKCFIKTWLTVPEMKRYEDGKLRIIETDYNDFCEGCLAIGPVVDYIEDEEEG